MWKTDGDDSYDTADVEGTTLSHNLTGLTQNTIYTFHTFATTTSGTEIGDEMSFTTPSFSVTPSASTPLKICDETTSVIVTYTAEVMNNQTDATSSYTYSWSSHSGNALANGSTYTVTYTAPGLYSVSCTATPTGDGDALDPATASISIKGCPCTVSSIQQGVEHDAGNGSTIDSVKDDDGNWYGVVEINGQCWMAQNLRTTVYYDSEADNNTISIPVQNGSNQAPSSSNACIYNFNNREVSVYGYLYNWAAATGGKSESISPGDMYDATVRGVCPAGWHLPSYYDVYLLRANTLDKQGNFYYSTGRLVGTGPQLDETWITNGVNCETDAPCNPNYIERNITGFNAVRSQYYEYNSDSGNLSLYPYAAGFWTSYKSDASSSAIFKIMNDSPICLIPAQNIFGAMSVRCVRDE